MNKFKFLENIATADCCFEAYGKTPEELFENAALALMEVMVDTNTISKREKQNAKLKLKSKNLENLLFDFLNELVFLKDRDNLFFSKFKIKIKKMETGGWIMENEVFGEPIDPKRHHLKVDVKAVTRHLFELKKEKNQYLARVVLDI